MLNFPTLILFLIFMIHTLYFADKEGLLVVVSYREKSFMFQLTLITISEFICKFSFIRQLGHVSTTTLIILLSIPKSLWPTVYFSCV